MPFIQFNPPDESNHSIMGGRLHMHGGLQLDKATRLKYLSLSQQIFEPNANQKEISEEMLHIIVDASRNYIESLPESHRERLHSILDQIIRGIDPTETNYTGLLNIVALQLAVFFTRYVAGMKEQNAYLKNRGINIDRYVPFSDDISGSNQVDVYQNIWGTYAVYSEVKKIIEASFEKYKQYYDDLQVGTRLILNPVSSNSMGIETPISRWKYIPIIGFVTLTEMVDSIFNNIWYIGLAFDVQYVDGSALNPLGYYIHDIGHSLDIDLSLKGRKGMPDMLKIFREFRDFLRNTNKPREIIYSIYLVLFYMIHEGGINLTFNYGFLFLKKTTVESHLSEEEEPLSIYIKELLYKFQDVFEDLNNAGRSIPAQYRKAIDVKNPDKLDPTEIKKYLDITHERYMNCWEEFQKSRASQGGRRHTRRNRHTRRSRHNKKRRSTRRR
jgi:hypothetical protein